MQMVGDVHGDGGVTPVHQSWPANVRDQSKTFHVKNGGLEVVANGILCRGCSKTAAQRSHVENDTNDSSVADSASRARRFLSRGQNVGEPTEDDQAQSRNIRKLWLVLPA